MLVDRKYTIGKSSNRSPELFSILAKLSNIQKIPLFNRKALHRTIILIDKFSKLLWGEKDGYYIT